MNIPTTRTNLQRPLPHHVVQVKLHQERLHYESHRQETIEEDDPKMRDDIQISINNLMKELNKASKSSTPCCVYQMPPKSCIFKVPRQLRQVNPEAYEPQIIAIGPYYHHRKEHLKPMEEHKKHCLNTILARNPNVSLEKYVEAMRRKERAARHCYAEDVGMSPKDFSEMLLLDGCFIIELIRAPVLMVNEMPSKYGDGQIFRLKVDLPIVAYDLLLLENQLPLFILEELFDMSKKPDDDEEQGESFVERALSFFCLATDYHQNYNPKRDYKHLLGLVHSQCVSQVKVDDHKRPSNTNPKLRSMRNATALEEAGVTFQKIPTLRIDDNTELMFRNLIAYEQFNGDTYVSDYAVIMDCLINSDKDVELLHRQGIIANWLGDHEAVANMINRLCDHVSISQDFKYQQVCKNSQDYCDLKWNEWRATLKHDYFKNPWALISFLAALLLLLITVTQFIISFFSL
ncbi:hypothetical protein COLO4_20188 [Corchorus olitorius]|uniref:Uncharacterized protein n=1 Tax=Corchorus olitorius TaxID=93759 RepID=A0A1R3J174_9ROSI|nr:hypothetical protein COLO4_20188 [Corchorus olitorius]